MREHWRKLGSPPDCQDLVRGRIKRHRRALDLVSLLESRFQEASPVLLSERKRRSRLTTSDAFLTLKLSLHSLRRRNRSRLIDLLQKKTGPLAR